MCLKHLLRKELVRLACTTTPQCLNGVHVATMPHYNSYNYHFIQLMKRLFTVPRQTTKKNNYTFSQKHKPHKKKCGACILQVHTLLNAHLEFVQLILVLAGNGMEKNIIVGYVSNR